MAGSFPGVARAYARRIIRGEITIDDVPETIRAEVEAALAELAAE